jgi:hypothetical protein
MLVLGKEKKGPCYVSAFNVVLGSQPSWSFFLTFSAVPLGCLCPLDEIFNSGGMASHLGN